MGTQQAITDPNGGMDRLQRPGDPKGSAAILSAHKNTTKGRAVGWSAVGKIRPRQPRFADAAGTHAAALWSRPELERDQ